MTSLPVIPLTAASAAGVFYAGLGLAYKRADAAGCRALPFQVVYALISGMVMLAASTMQSGAWGDPRLWALAGASGVMLVLAVVSLLKANSLGPASVTWTITNLSLLLPIAAFAFLGEPVRWADLLLVALFVGMIGLFGRGIKQAGDVHAGNAKGFVLALAGLFLANGTFLTLSKLQNKAFGGGSTAAYGVLIFLVTATIALSAHGLSAERRRFDASEWKAGAFAGTTNGLGFLCMLTSLSLPASVAFPLSHGISLLGGVSLTMIAARERLNAAKALGFALGAALVVASVMRDQLAAWLGG